MKPVITITSDFVAVETKNMKAQCTRDRFLARIPGEEIDVEIEKFGRATDDPFINLLTGLAWMVERELTTKNEKQ